MMAASARSPYDLHTISTRSPHDLPDIHTRSLCDPTASLPLGAQVRLLQTDAYSAAAKMGGRFDLLTAFAPADLYDKVSCDLVRPPPL